MDTNILKILVGALAVGSAVNVVLTIRELNKLEKSNIGLLRSVGIKNVDGGVRCFLGILSLAFSSRNPGVTTYARWIFRGYIFGYIWLGALFCVFAATGLREL
jgi:hypothetical protein